MKAVVIILFPLSVWASSPETIIILPTRTPTPTPLPTLTPVRDFNKDGVVNAKDLFGFVQGWQKSTVNEVVPVTLPLIDPQARPLRLVRIPAGLFHMGSPAGERGREFDEGPVHAVGIGYDFYLGETEVTQAQWQAITGRSIAEQRDLAGPQLPLSGIGDDFPVYYVSWNDAQQFLTGLNALGQGTFRLPSEAEWEYACRAGTQTRFHFGDSLDCGDNCEDCAGGDPYGGNRSDYMWFCWSHGGNGFPEGPKKVAQLLPNPFGLYDMHGNTLELCQDWWHTGYTGAPTDGSAREIPAGSQRAVRSGIAYTGAEDSRSADRHAIEPTDRHPIIGLRVAMTATDN